ncbi:hypothetical protein PMI35_06106 [Pseudomonas sp. GM78]|uniref:hypothetical protein n=1 Tax=Pseudomonas sp. GM78 TaxID=1144337 RepID=UPI000270C1E1|nr:hypothetical protein [Pseudomonas sp. GM78]EJN18528.1 hypothetical protein PMI35_06106 [Pseudomonas sp. GM78]
MQGPTIKRTGIGTINAIRKVWVDATSIQFAMVLPDEGCSRLAIRIGLNLMADGSDYFHVGDKVQYTLLKGPVGAVTRAQDLVRF